MTPVDLHGSPVSWEADLRPARVCLRWRVGVDTARRVFGVESRAPHVEIELTGNGESPWHAQVHVAGDEDTRRLLRSATATVAWTPDKARHLLHLDAEGVVHATFEIEQGRPRVLYVRTGVLAETGLPGGRYEVAGARLDLADAD